MTKELIVARYQEDLSWLDKVPDDIKITVYNKGEDILDCSSIPLPNIGREAHSFLYHIVENWSELSDYVIFVQGNPFDHCSKFLERITDNKLYHDSCVYLCNYHIIEGMTGNKGPQHPEGLEIEKYLKLFHIPYKHKKVDFAPGAQYIVPRERIYQHQLRLYRKMKEQIEASYKENPNPLEAYVYERIWSVLYDKANYR